MQLLMIESASSLLDIDLKENDYLVTNKHEKIGKKKQKSAKHWRRSKIGNTFLAMLMLHLRVANTFMFEETKRSNAHF